MFIDCKAEDNRRYLGLIVTRIKLSNSFMRAQKKGDPAGISFKLYTLLLCVFDYCIYQLF